MDDNHDDHIAPNNKGERVVGENLDVNITHNEAS